MNPNHAGAFDPERLREHAVSLRALARTLVLDPAAADDLVQRTMLRAIERPPRIAGPIRAWLATVLGNEARQAWRSDRRRTRREERVAGPRVERSTSELVEEFEGHVLLTRAIQALDEIHREAILLRFFEDLPPRRIAQRLGLPVRTVESRLQRALLRLRDELDGSGTPGDRSWVAVLMPLVRPRVEVGIGVVGIMSLKVVSLALIGTALLASLAFLWPHAPERSEPAAPASQSAHVPDRPAQGESHPSPQEPVGVAQEREPSASQSVAGKENQVVSRAAKGVLLDTAGIGLEQIEVVARPLASGDRVVGTTTTAGGEFEFVGPPGQYQLDIADARYLLLVEATLELEPALSDDGGATAEASESRTTRCVLIAERAVTARGVVTDASQVPLPGVNVAIALPERLRVLFGEAGERAKLRTFAAKSQAEGRFECARVPAIDGLLFEAARVGFENATFVARAAEIENVALVMKPTAEHTQILEGIVRGADNDPIERAFVVFGEMPTYSDAEGRFRFEYDPTTPPTSILALVRGRLPVTERRDTNGVNPWPAFLELRIDAEPKRISGRVFGVDGAPLTRGSVNVAESTRISTWNGGIWCAEQLVRGEDVLRVHAELDAEGRFVLEGLLDRAYSLTVVDLSRALLVDVGSFAAGSEGVQIRLPADAVNARVEGRVIDGQGQPVEGASVHVECQLLAFEDTKLGKYFDSVSGDPSQTDEQGRFVLTQVPVAQATLEVEHESLFTSTGVPVPAKAFSGIVEITVFRRCEVRVEVDASAGYSEFELQDGHGKKVMVLREETHTRTYLEKAGIFDGRSELLATSDAAVRLILRTADGTSTVRDVRLVPGSVNVLR